MKRIESVPLAEVAVGMVVAEPVLDSAGRVLVPAGADVSESMLLGLRRRDVAEIRVEREVEEDPAVSEAYRLKLVARLDHLFRQAGEGAETRALQQAVLAYRMEHRA